MKAFLKLKVIRISLSADIYGKHIKNETIEEGNNCARVYIDNRNTLLQSRIKAALNFVASLPFVDSDKVSLTANF
jgi:hypothetical protein